MRYVFTRAFAAPSGPRPAGWGARTRPLTLYSPFRLSRHGELHQRAQLRRTVLVPAAGAETLALMRTLALIWSNGGDGDEDDGTYVPWERGATGARLLPAPPIAPTRQ